MDEYIERAAAVTVCDKKYRECLRKSDFCGDTVAWNICADIKAIPAADVAPVVRCKDCKHFNHKRMECENEAISTDHEGGAQYSLNFWLDDFCSYGEPKEV